MSNLKMLHTIAKGLDYLLPSVVFVGGSVTEIYATDAAATEVRPTDDVDCVIELVSYATYGEFEEKLRKLKFVNDTEDGVICRWKFAGLKVDIMPDDPDILGFTNEWYKKGLAHTFEYNFEDGTTICIFQTPYFLASKFAALKDRGGNDFRISSDFEDIIYVLDNRINLYEELKTASNDVVAFIRNECLQLLRRRGLQEDLFCVLPIDGASRIDSVLQTIKSISEII